MVKNRLLLISIQEHYTSQQTVNILHTMLYISFYKFQHCFHLYKNQTSGTKQQEVSNLSSAL